MSGKTMGRILTAALITATLATPLPARATTTQGRVVSHPAWSWLTSLWSTFGGSLLPHQPEPAGTKQGVYIDPNGGPLPTNSCTDSGACGTGPVVDPNR